MANKVRCNVCVAASQPTTTFTFSDWDNYNGGLISGIASIQDDITNEVVTNKYYYCPQCQKKLKHSNSTLGSVEGTFDIVNETGDVVQISGGSSDESGDEDITYTDEYKARYKYEPINFVSEDETQDQKEQISWINNGRTTYGTKAMNYTQEGIVEAHRLLKLKEQQTRNMAFALKKLRMGDLTKIAVWGDSVMWGFYTAIEEKELGTDYVAPNNTDDFGKSDSSYPNHGIYQAKVRIPESMIEALQYVYGNNIVYVNKVWTGTHSGISTIMSKGQEVLEPNSTFAHFKASRADIAIINFGINDAMGGHVDASYTGHPELFISGYRALIERELENGTAVICLSPSRQAVKSTNLTDTDDRTMIDVYEQIIHMIANDYNIPFIDGNIMTKNIPNVRSIDFTHFDNDGNREIGYRLASMLIGQTPGRPMYVTDGSYLAVRHQIDNVNITGTAVYSSNDNCPNVPMALSTPDLNSTTTTREAGGLQVDLVVNGEKETDGTAGSVVWSFYCDRDGMVVIPSIGLEDNTTVVMELDFGADQGLWSSYWNATGNDTAILRDYKEPSTVTINNAACTNNRYSKAQLTATHSANRVIRITTEGWHTIRIKKTSATGGVHVYGIDFMGLNSYNNLLLLKSKS